MNPLQKFKDFLQTIGEDKYTVVSKDGLFIVEFYQAQRWCTFYFNNETGELLSIEVDCSYCINEGAEYQ